MQVVNDHLGSDGEQLLVKVDVSHERAVRLPTVKIAQMVAEKRLPAPSETKNPFKLPPDGQNWARTIERQR